MENVFFLPFVGRDYLSGGIFGRRVMVLGESHYCGERCANCGVPGKAGDCAAFTSGVIERYLDPKAEREPWMNTYLKFERSLKLDDDMKLQWLPLDRKGSKRLYRLVREMAERLDGAAC